MKKILMFMSLLVLLFPLSLKALNYSEWSDTIPQDIEKDNIEIETRYKYYKLQRTNIEYKPLGYLTDKIIDNTKTQLSEWSEYSEIYPQNSKDLEIESKNFIEKYDTEKVSFIDILNPNNSYKEIPISEIQIKNKTTNKLIDYKITCNILDNNCKTINDNDLTSVAFNTKNGITLRIDLNDTYNSKDIEIIIISTSLDSSFNSMIINYKLSEIAVTLSKNIYKTINFKSYHNKYSTLNISEDKTWIKEGIRNYTKFRFREKLYEYYNLEIKYLDGYYKDEVKTYIKDEYSAKNFYRYDKDNIKKTIVIPPKTLVNDDKDLPLVKKDYNEPIAILESPTKNSKNYFWYYFTIFFILTGITLSVLVIVYKEIKKKIKLCRTK